MVRPIFYKVKPSDVRHQRGTFGEALARHEQNPEYDIIIVRRWDAALFEAASLSSWPFMDQNESRFIKRIVKEIADQVSNPKLTPDEIRDPLLVTAIVPIPKPADTVLQVRWSRPAEGYLKINYDGAYTVRKGGLSVVARDTKGRFVAAKCMFVNVGSVDDVVAMAALEALYLAKELRWPRVCFEGDSARVMNALQSSNAYDDSDASSSSSSSSFGQFISEIQYMSRIFQQSTFSLVHQRANGSAETLATHALSNPKEKHWLDNPPSVIEYSFRVEQAISSR